MRIYREYGGRVICAQKYDGAHSGGIHLKWPESVALLNKRIADSIHACLP